VVALAGCETKQGNEDLVSGKQMFVAKCGSCHVLQRAGTSGTTGPNLDAAFHQSVKDGFKRSTFQGQIYSQIRFPNRNSLMGALARNGKIPHDSRDAANIAAYVASVVSRPGSDTGALARAVEKITRIPVATARAACSRSTPSQRGAQIHPGRRAVAARQGPHQVAEQGVDRPRHPRRRRRHQPGRPGGLQRWHLTGHGDPQAGGPTSSCARCRGPRRGWG